MKATSKLFPVILLLLGLSPAQAQDGCSELHLDSERGPLRAMPIMDQPSENCFAHVASELVDAWRFSHPVVPPPPAPIPEPVPGGSKHVTSPIPLTDGLGRQKNQDMRKKGGMVSDAVDYLIKNGSCNHRAIFGSDENGLNSERQKELEVSLYDAFNAQLAWEKKNIAWLHNKSDELVTRHPDWDIFRVSLETFYQGAMASGNANLLCRDLSAQYGAGQMPNPFSNKNTLTQMMAAMLAENKSTDDLISDYYKRVCAKSSIPVTSPRLTATYVGDHKLNPPAAIEKMIGDRLDLPNPQPIGIDICAQVLKTKDAHAWNADKPGDCDGGQRHSVIIIGRKLNPDSGKCQFILRNSWGTDCWQYKVGAKLSCDARGQPAVDADLLTDNVFRLNWLGN